MGERRDSEQENQEERRDRDAAPTGSEDGGQQFRLLLGRVSAFIGLLVVVAGIISVFVSQDASVASISPGVIGIALGAVGYFMGARRLGLLVAVLGLLAAFLSLAATQGIVPGGPEGKQNLFEGPPGDQQP